MSMRFRYGFLLSMVAACLVVACGNKTAKTVSVTDSPAVDSLHDEAVDKHSEAYIRQRIDTIYKFVGKITYDAEGNRDYNYSPFNLDSAYCSERYYALMQEALEICDETGDILYDYDYWVCGQDISDDWSYKVAKVYHVTDSTALVDMIIHNFSDTENTIALRFERDDWYIDDFNPSPSGNDDKASLRRFIKQGKEAHEKAKTLAGDWGWVGENCPELLLDLEMTDKGLKARQCDVYRMYGFDKTTITFDGEHLTVTEANEAADDELAPENQIRLFLHLDQNGDLVGDCSISHRLASKGYEGPIRLRKGYFFYRDGVK
ncbi:MAG: DUF3828 domain-containing protein [Prevotella sp.]|nr:DUF3828 domain-containing protein [Prevotella sp.]